MATGTASEQGDLAARLAAGRAAFNRGAFYEAHELWETVWLELQGADRSLVQGLIQIAAGLHHAQNNRGRPATTLLTKGLEKLGSGSPGAADSLGVVALSAAVVGYLKKLAAAGGTLPDPAVLTL